MKKAKTVALGLLMLMMTMGAEKSCATETPETGPANEAPAPAAPKDCAGSDCDYGDQWYVFELEMIPAKGVKSFAILITDDSESKQFRVMTKVTPISLTKKVKYQPDREIMLKAEPKVLPPPAGMSRCLIKKVYADPSRKPEAIDFGLDGKSVRAHTCIKPKGK